MSPFINVTLHLPTELVERLSHLAETTGRSPTHYMQQAIEKHLDNLEDLYLAEQALNVQKGEEETIPLDYLIKEYGPSVENNN